MLPFRPLRFLSSLSALLTAAAPSKFHHNNPNSTTKMSEGSELATFAAGCFWGVEHLYLKHYKGKGVLSTQVGYSNGKEELKNVTYKQVCSGNTDYAEVCQVQFDPKQVSYEELVTFFFKIHDPTQMNQQGPDVGTQYRSGIYTHSPAQQTTAESVKSNVQKYFKSPIATEIKPLKNYYTAEEYHQKYLIQNPSGYHCPSHFVREFKE
ncbi:peptide methionine sulfoxide reductase MsrA [Paraphysoderma sedebokerense]|nr:peptide methionine sulfoxide reductase MsrA [Paraphysoderma sedebokerense]KAI9142607.1 peptide methionine sulfoxide reductase MsrA [Paraphysoderma sedebokerense]